MGPCCKGRGDRGYRTGRGHRGYRTGGAYRSDWCSGRDGSYRCDRAGRGYGTGRSDRGYGYFQFCFELCDRDHVYAGPSGVLLDRVLDQWLELYLAGQ